MSDFGERLKHYDTECRQHLSRVRLSHELALGAVRSRPARLGEEYDVLIRASLGTVTQDELETKLCMVLNELHLVSLKANFELFLNRLLSTIWKFHFARLTFTISGDERVSLRELVDSLVESSTDARDFVIDKIVPRYGLREFGIRLRKATHIDLPDVLYRKDFHYWPQIHTAFEVRHLVEHRDNRVDTEFRTRLARDWTDSSWGKRQDLGKLERVVVEKEDVIETYTAMFEATSLLTEEVLSWSSRSASAQPTA